MQLNPYLLFNGQCEEAFKYYERVLGGKITAILLHEGSPGASHVPPEWGKKVMHAHMTVGDQVLMGSDAPPGYYQPPAGFSVSIQLKDAKEGERIFNALAEGGKVKMPFAETFWAARFGMLTDRFGIPWMINCQKAA